MTEIEWYAPEYEYHPKNILWFWTTIIIALLLLAWSIWQKNFLFGVFVIIAEILILIWGAQKPKLLKFKINNDGIAVGDYKLYKFSEISNFSITENLETDFLILKLNFRKILSLNVSMLIPINIISQIKNVLKEKNIEEVEYEEHFLDILQKILKF